jgi:hypothetical protein
VSLRPRVKAPTAALMYTKVIQGCGISPTGVAGSLLPTHEHIKKFNIFLREGQEGQAVYSENTAMRPVP